MDNAKLREVMKYHLSNFATDLTKITDETIHDTILSDSDGYGSANSKRIYKSFIRWTILQSGGKDKPWPNRWIEFSVAKLANRLIALDTNHEA